MDSWAFEKGSSQMMVNLGLSVFKPVSISVVKVFHFIACMGCYKRLYFGRSSSNLHNNIGFPQGTARIPSTMMLSVVT